MTETGLIHKGLVRSHMT